MKITLRSNSRKAARKSWFLVGLTVAMWLGTLVLLGPNLIAVLELAQHGANLFMLSAFSALLVFFWLLGAYFVAVALVYSLSRTSEKKKNIPGAPLQVQNPPRVAILYPTCNDFQRDAVLTCLAQDYPVFHVFILDDSRDEHFRLMVDSFRQEFPSQVTVVRRPDKAGFKAGNLNYALHGPAKDYPLFAVMDADERIPTHFLKDSVILLESSGCAFVQANHAPNPGQPELFARIMGQTILPFWSVLLPTKNRFGFVSCIGHGVLARRSAWEVTGGFPEVASEDLAFSAVLLEQGLRGTYAADIVCYEDFPSDIAAFRKQQERYVAGVLQSLLRYWPRILKSSRVSWIEKIDFLLGCLPIYVPTACLLFILLAGVGVPLSFGGINALDSGWDAARAHFRNVMDYSFSPLRDPKFTLLSLFFTISPSLLMLMLILKGHIKQPVRSLVFSNLAYLSTMTNSLFALLKYFARLPIGFDPTGQHSRSAPRLTKRHNLALPLLAVEVAAAVSLGVVQLAMFNFGFAALAATPALARWFGRDSLLFGSAAALVFCVILGQIVCGFALGIGAPAWPSLVLSVHF